MATLVGQSHWLDAAAAIAAGVETAMVAANCMLIPGSIIRRPLILVIAAAITTASPVVDAVASLTGSLVCGVIVNMPTLNVEAADRYCQSDRAEQVAMDAALAVTVASAVRVAT